MHNLPENKTVEHLLFKIRLISYSMRRNVEIEQGKRGMTSTVSCQV